MPNPDVQPEGRRRPGTGGYETRDADAKWIFGIVAGLLVAGLAMHFCLAGFVAHLRATPTPTDALAGVRRAPEIAPKNFPRLQISPAADLAEFREREERELRTYGWIDRTAGVVRLPVDRAMELILQRGLPVRTDTNGNGLGPSSYELMRQRPLSPPPEIREEK